MILAKRKNDLYENISDDFLTLRSNSMRAKAERIAKCKSVPSFIDSKDLLRPDEQYVQSNDDGFMRRRNQWSTASYQRPSYVGADLGRKISSNDTTGQTAFNQMPPSQPPSIPNRHSHARRSMSILDDKENCNPCQFLPPKPCLKDERAVKKGHLYAEGGAGPGGPALRPKMKSIEVSLPRSSPKGYRLSTGASLSPHSKIFSAPRT